MLMKTTIASTEGVNFSQFFFEMFDRWNNVLMEESIFRRHCGTVIWECSYREAANVVRCHLLKEVDVVVAVELLELLQSEKGKTDDFCDDEVQQSCIGNMSLLWRK